MADRFDHEFAKKFQALDRPVSFDAEKVLPTVQARKTLRSKRAQTRLWAAGIFGASFIIACLFFQLRPLTKPGFSVENIAQNEQEPLPDEETPEQSLLVETNELTLEQLALELQKAQQEYDRLAEIETAQQFSILKEVISRTEVNQQAIAAYHF